MNKKNLKAVDFFCSGGGMTNGMRQAGIKVIAGIDNDETCKETYEFNNPGSAFLHEDVFELTAKELESRLSLQRNDDDLILIGCSPCQYWSVIQTDKTRSKKSRNLLLEFERFVQYFNPGYVLVENVPGILKKKESSGLESFIENLVARGYSVHYGVVNLNEYGVPQSRQRFSLLATRLHKTPIFPKANKRRRPTVRSVLGPQNGFPKLQPGTRDTRRSNHSTAAISPLNLLRLKKTRKNGGSWSDWAADKSLRRRHYRGDGFPDNYGRMAWDKPAPTITTRFHSISNGRFAHPSENRGMSIREGATLQTFPKSYYFPHERLAVSARIIGNAVPPVFARRLAETIIRSHTSRA